MRKGLLGIYGWMLLVALFAFSSVSMAATDPAPGGQEESAEKVNVDTELVKLQKQLDGIKQQISGTTTDAKLSVLNDTTLELVANADKLAGVLTPMRAQLQAQLDVLGPAPQPQAAVSETAEVTRKRATLNQQKQKLDTQASQVQAIKTGAENLSTQILALRRNALKNQLALNSGSMLGSRFWSPIIKPVQEDIDRLSDLKDDLTEAFIAAWQPGWRYGSAFFLLLAVALSTAGRKLLEKYLARAGIHLLPEGRLRRSFLAIAVVLSTVLMMGMAVLLVDYVFTRHGDVTDRAAGFMENLVRLVVFCSMISGLGRAFLSNKRPSWRLPAIANPVARAMEPFSIIATGFIVVFGVIEQINTTSGISVGVTIVGNGLSSLFLALTSGAIALRSNQIRRRMVEAGETPEARSTLSGLIHLAVLLTTLAVLVSLLIGYISLARFLTYELVWVGMVLSLLYLSTTFVEDVCESLFSPAFASGRQIKRTLNLDDRHLDQAAAILSAGLKVLLILMAVVALLNGTFGSTTPVDLVQKAVEIWGGKGLESISIVPAHLVNAVVLLVIGIYSLRVSRRWLEHEFFPKTTLEAGIKASLVTLYSNIGYILIILLTLATLGIEWSKLAWIVSALSVGIGFGLQEIVKNFISGLILLTERPVKVGDLVNISGVEGDIRRINVRATEIQLGDRSTVIVPNSQFISQNVRNITMGNPQGVATLALTFPLDIDPDVVKNILLDAYHAHEKILETPVPSVMFSQLTPNGMVLSVTGYVGSPRMVASAKSDLLFDIIKRLRTASIPLAVPQKMVLESNVDVAALQADAVPRQ
ncbi:mechanosensitive ion channel family protein [Dickeya dianthicola]|uniref:DUF3772 domain-containing protein n=1 Tax=Dickeya dianthicola TaxID=204039 RepID=A0AAX1C8J9_9GAMM|nr:DUF3772 domain-containing protein [Dickeya dianthicola]ATO33988.1 potassium efflux system KefA [Dickeya dianthicola RNS04.9]MBT1428941.1 DUF3772 domain-containing protein [Dickeya dianthicola]MBT1432971.1 DUF3772 domain-containing protein [Dickeya dianthicola]MBT1460442.1 DUF3772 domain-containing protein [Dickeya dianthicola]MBT1489639.1 DUF3772 domain-containing protein [Dickeya dianthicola]